MKKANTPIVHPTPIILNKKGKGDFKKNIETIAILGKNLKRKISRKNVFKGSRRKPPVKWALRTLRTHLKTTESSTKKRELLRLSLVETMMTSCQARRMKATIRTPIHLIAPISFFTMLPITKTWMKKRMGTIWKTICMKKESPGNFSSKTDKSTG